MERLAKYIIPILIVLSHSPVAARSPFQIKEDRLYKYYQGRSKLDKDEVTAFENATQDAYRQAIQENFGVYTRYQSDYLGGLKNYSLVVRNREHSQQVFIHDFERLQSKVVERGGQEYLYVLFRYSKSAIAKEKARLRKAKQNLEPILNQVGESERLYNTRLQVITHPPRAEVFLNKQRWGVTPIDLKGLNPGQYELVIDHPHYTTIHETLYVSEKRTQKIEKTLIPAKTTFDVLSDPDGAEVHIDGRRVGETPLGALKISANELHTLTLKHPHTETVSRTLRGSKDQSQTIDVKLPYLMTYFSINSNPEGAKLFVDGEPWDYSTQSPPHQLGIPVGLHNITLKKEGYEDFSVTHEFEPQKPHHFGQIELKEARQLSSTEDLESNTASFSDYEQVEFNPWKYTLGLEINSPTNDYFKDPWFYSVSFSVENRFSNHVGLILGASYDLGLSSEDGSSSSEPQYELSGYGARLAIPIYFSAKKGSWFLSLEGGLIKHTYKDEVSFNNPLVFKLTQQRYGLSVGQSMIDNILEWRISLLNYQQKNREDFQSMGFTLGFQWD